MNQTLHLIQTDGEDFLIFVKEVFLIVWRQNPVATAMMQFQETFQQLQGDTPNSQRAAVIGGVLASGQLTGMNEFIFGFTQYVSNTVESYRQNLVELTCKIYPDIRTSVSQSISASTLGSVDFYADSVRRSIEYQHPTYDILLHHYQQLQEFFPRYSELMNRSDVGSTILSLAAGFFGGYAGAAGAQVWENWRCNSDAEFIQKFGEAIDNYVQRSNEFVQRGEESLNVVFDRIIEDIREAQKALYLVYDQLEIGGRDLHPLYLEHRRPAQNISDEYKQVCVVALQSLAENRSVPTRCIINLKQILQL